MNPGLRMVGVGVNRITELWWLPIILLLLFFCRWEMHEKILKALKKTSKIIKAWWEYTGKPEPTEDEILDSLKRLVSGVLTHPVTIGKRPPFNNNGT